jgi:hypothetical protein
MIQIFLDYQRWAVRKKISEIANPQIFGFAELPQMEHFADFRFAYPILSV